MLLAWERGLGTHWKTISNDPRQRAFLGLKDNEQLVGFLHLGYPAKLPVARERAPVRERITYIREAEREKEDVNTGR
jgi:nitroreductase